MISPTHRNYFGLLVVGICIAGCNRQATPTNETANGKPVVVTTFYPTQYFCERIGGDLLEVVCPVPADEDAIYWKPDAEAIQVYQNADVIVLNGAGFAKWVSKVSLPENRIINSAKPLEDELITFRHVAMHSHGPGGEHAHEGIDGHTWVDPVNAKHQATEIKQALVKKYPQHKAAFEQGFTALAKDLDALDAKLKELSFGKQPLLASHPAFNYLARRYDWNIKSLDLDPEKMPSDRVIQGIQEILTNHTAKYVLWEAAPTNEIADRLEEELGLTSIEFSPCELLAEQDIQEGLDYLKVMQQNLENLQVEP